MPRSGIKKVSMETNLQDFSVTSLTGINAEMPVSGSKKVSMEPHLQDFSVTSLTDLNPDAPGPSDSSFFQLISDYNVVLSEISTNTTENINLSSGPYPADSTMIDAISIPKSSESVFKKPFGLRSRKKPRPSLFDSLSKDSDSESPKDAEHLPLRRKKKIHPVNGSIFDLELSNSSLNESKAKSNFVTRRKERRKEKNLDSLFDEDLENITLVKDDSLGSIPVLSKRLKKAKHIDNSLQKKAKDFESMFDNIITDVQSSISSRKLFKRRQSKIPVDSKLFDFVDSLSASQSENEKSVCNRLPLIKSSSKRVCSLDFDDILNASDAPSVSNESSGRQLDSRKVDSALFDDVFDTTFNETHSTNNINHSNKSSLDLASHSSTNKCALENTTQNESTNSNLENVNPEIIKEAKNCSIEIRQSINRTFQNYSCNENQVSESSVKSKHCNSLVSKSQTITEESQFDTITKESHSDTLTEESHSDTITEESHSDTITEESHTDIITKESQSDPLTEECQSHPITTHTHEDSQAGDKLENVDNKKQCYEDIKEPGKPYFYDSGKTAQGYSCNDSLSHENSVKSQHCISQEFQSQNKITQTDSHNARPCESGFTQLNRDNHIVCSTPIVPARVRFSNRLSVNDNGVILELKLRDASSQDKLTCSPLVVESPDKEMVKNDCSVVNVDSLETVQHEQLLKDHSPLKNNTKYSLDSLQIESTSDEMTLSSSARIDLHTISIKPSTSGSSNFDSNHVTKQSFNKDCTNSNIHQSINNVRAHLEDSAQDGKVHSTNYRSEVGGNQLNFTDKSIQLAGQDDPLELEEQSGGKDSPVEREHGVDEKNEPTEAEHFGEEMEKTVYEENGVDETNEPTEADNLGEEVETTVYEEHTNYEELSVETEHGSERNSEPTEEEDLGDEMETTVNEEQTDDEESSVETEHGSRRNSEPTEDEVETNLNEDQTDEEHQSVQEEESAEDEISEESHSSKGDQTDGAESENARTVDEGTEMKLTVCKGNNTEVDMNYNASQTNEEDLTNDTKRTDKNSSRKVASVNSKKYSRRVSSINTSTVLMPNPQYMVKKPLRIPSKRKVQEILDKIPLSELKERRRKFLPAESKIQIEQKEIEQQLINRKVQGTKCIKSNQLKRPRKWVTPKLYDFLISKLKPKFGIRSRLRAENLVLFLVEHVDNILKENTDYYEILEEMKIELANLEIIVTHLDFENFVYKYFDGPFVYKVYPVMASDIVNPYEPDDIYESIL